MAKRNAQSYLRRQLGKKSADAVLSKLDRLAKKGVSAKTIEGILRTELEAHIEAKVIPTLNRAIKRGVSEAIKTVPPLAIKTMAIKAIKPSVARPRKGSK